MQKTVRGLIERYQVFFVAAAPADDVYYQDVNQWLYEYVNVPAWGHTVFTVRRDLLYGDYLIEWNEEGGKKKDEGMATYIPFGSDTFKTWDDIAAYFERLGGQ